MRLCHGFRVDLFPAFYLAYLDQSRLGLIVRHLEYPSRGLVNLGPPCCHCWCGTKSLMFPDQAGRITLSPGETMATVRRRLGSAKKATGKNVQIRRVGGDIYFWEEPVKR